MPLGVIALVLAGALMHAAWNALVKSGRDTTLDTALVAVAASLLTLLALPFVPLPAPASWPYLVASLVLHQAYFASLVLAYQFGDLGYAYPLMRGTAPLLVALAGLVLLDDQAPATIGLGIIVISLGIFWLGGFRRPRTRGQQRATAFALLNACVIAAYTLVDGHGVRQSGHPLVYALWVVALIGLPFGGFVLFRHRSLLGAHIRTHGRNALIAAPCLIGSYSIALWAMTHAPIAAIAALRETSVIFAALIGTFCLKEPFGRGRIAGACTVALGIFLLHG